MKRVTFCGHRSLQEELVPFLKEELTETLVKLVRRGADEFFLGGYGDFDHLCLSVVLELKHFRFKHLNVVYVAPYPDRRYPFEEIYDFVVYPPMSESTKKSAIIKRNEYMVENSDVIIAYVKHKYGGAFKTLEYARKKEKTVIEL